ncbi:unnamed protein product, partial [Sphagnum tenellum]
DPGGTDTAAPTSQRRNPRIMMIHQPPGNNRWIKYPKGEGPQVARELEVTCGSDAAAGLPPVAAVPAAGAAAAAAAAAAAVPGRAAAAVAGRAAAAALAV